MCSKAAKMYIGFSNTLDQNKMNIFMATIESLILLISTMYLFIKNKI